MDIQPIPDQTADYLSEGSDIKVGFIAGRRGSVWRNDAYPIYRIDHNGVEDMIGVIPADDLRALNIDPYWIMPAFEMAASQAGFTEKKVLHQVVRDLLDMREFPKPGKLNICL